MNQRIYSPPYNCQPETACYCNSGKAFGQCCGSNQADRNAPAGVFVIENFLDKNECRKIVDYAEQQQREWLLVADMENSTEEKQAWKKDEKRITQSVDIRGKQGVVESWIQRAVARHIQPATGLKIQSFEPPCMLRYGEGGKYVDHVDGEAYDEQNGMWYRAIDRDVSILVYLNDDYQGGGLKFNNLNYIYQPKAGDLVFFPSGNIFRHESLPISRGVKYACVTWSMAVGTPRVNQ